MLIVLVIYMIVIRLLTILILLIFKSFTGPISTILNNWLHIRTYSVSGVVGNHCNGLTCILECNYVDVPGSLYLGTFPEVSWYIFINTYIDMLCIYIYVSATWSIVQSTGVLVYSWWTSYKSGRISYIVDLGLDFSNWSLITKIFMYIHKLIKQ